MDQHLPRNWRSFRAGILARFRTRRVSTRIWSRAILSSQPSPQKNLPTGETQLPRMELTCRKPMPDLYEDFHIRWHEIRSWRRAVRKEIVENANWPEPPSRKVQCRRAWNYPALSVTDSLICSSGWQRAGLPSSMSVHLLRKNRIEIEERSPQRRQE